MVTCLLSSLLLSIVTSNAVAQRKDRVKRATPRGTVQPPNSNDAKHLSTGIPDPIEDPEFLEYGIYLDTAPRAG